MARTPLVNAMLSSALVVGLALLAAGEVDSVIVAECPGNALQDEPVQIPHETDCTKYYTCLGSEKVLRECPFVDGGSEDNEHGDKLYFDSTIHQCNRPENVDCDQSKLLLERNIFEGQAGLPTKCPKYDTINETVLLPHEHDCTKFYMCSHGKKVPKQCPESDDDGNRLHFNFEEQTCDWPSNVNCTMAEPAMRATPLKIILPVPTECPARDSPNFTVHLAHEWDCTKFYKCFLGHRYLMSCPGIPNTDDKLHFNRFEQVCDWPWKAGCDSNEPTRPPPTRPPPTPPPPTRPPPTPPPPTRPPPTRPPPTRPPPTRPPPTRPPPTRPPPTRPPPTQPPPVPTPNPGIEGCLETCPNDDPPNFITALPHGECRKWCRCENHEVKVWTCPGNLHFSPTLRKCTSPELAGCENKFYPYRSSNANDDDEPLMNILGYKEHFKW